jgi:hypothetical protein
LVSGALIYPDRLFGEYAQRLSVPGAEGLL